MSYRNARPGVLLVCVLLAGSASAQTFGEITGTVTDPTGAVVVGAGITVVNTATAQVRRVESNDTGNYTVPFLVPGIYDIQAEHQGFKSSSRKGVTLQVSDVARIDFVMQVGGVTEIVEVSGGAPLLSTESTALGTVVETKRILELPLNGRNYLQLIALSPNVTAEMGAGGQADSRQGGERANQAYAIAGQRMQFNHFTLDGVENTDVNFNTFIIRPSVEALQEFKVQTGIYSAEYGRATAQINATTKPGANDFHATLFEFLRNDKIDAKEWLNAGDKNPFRRNQYGFTLSGRLIRDKLFFLSNFEANRDSKTLQGRSNIATDRIRSGDFSATGRQVFDPASRVFRTDAQGNQVAVSATRFLGDVIPRNRFHPAALKLLEFYPTPNQNKGDDINRNYIRNRHRPISWEQFTQRIDWNERDNSNWFGRFSWGDEFVKRIAAFPQQEGQTTTKVYQAMLSNARTFGPSMVNEFRFGYNQFQNDQLLHFAFTRNVTQELGIGGLRVPPPSAWGTPSIGMENGISGWGEDSLGPFLNNNHTFQALDNVSIVRGKHSIKFGVEVRRDRYNQEGNQFPRGSFIFQAKATFDPARRAPTGHSFADFLLGESRRSEHAPLLAITLFRSSSYYAYVEDAWKITPRLTLTAGLRYENTPPYYDKYRGIMNLQIFDPGVGPNGLLPGTRTPIYTRPGTGDFHEGLPFRFHDGIPTQVGDQFMGRGLVASDNNDFAPRLGLAYSPTNRWSIRTGIGAFYTQDTGNPRYDMARNTAGRGRYESDEEKPNSNLSDPWFFERLAFRCSNWDGPCFGPPYALGNTHGRRTPYVIQWMFDLQRQLTNELALEASYMGNEGHKLERLVAFNESILRTGPGDNRTIEQRRPWAAYGRGQTVANVVNSNYHALSLKATQRFSRGFTYLVGYTWSKAMDTGSAIRTNSGDNLFARNSYNLRGERALSQFHNKRRLVTSFIYELPFGAGKTFANAKGVVDKVVGGWQLQSILTFTDGTPINVGITGDRANIGHEDYPDATGISPFLENAAPLRFWNIAAFDPNNPGLQYRNGSAARNVLFNPGLRQWDFSLNKNIPIKEGHEVQFRFEAFNFGNHPNWNAPPTDARAPATFGIITSARTMRELQFGLKYSF